MEGRRNAALADMARDAEIERSDFLVRAGEQLERFMAAHQAKIRDLGGLVLIDDDPDYLAVAPDGTFRSRSRVFDEAPRASGSPRRRSSRRPRSSPSCTTRPTSSRRSPTRRPRTRASTSGRARSPRRPADGGLYAEAADQWAAGQPEVREATDEPSAALALYELALDFQDRSQRTEAGLIEQFENAAAGVLGHGRDVRHRRRRRRAPGARASAASGAG